MIPSPEHHERIARLTLATVYPLYLEKITKKGRTRQELEAVICWLTGFSMEKIHLYIERQSTFEEIFLDACLPVEANKITGKICGYRVEEIDNKLTREIRYLDKLVDELAKGKSLDKIIRK